MPVICEQGPTNGLVAGRFVAYKAATRSALKSKAGAGLQLLVPFCVSFFATIPFFIDLEGLLPRPVPVSFFVVYSLFFVIVLSGIVRAPKGLAAIFFMLIILVTSVLFVGIPHSYAPGQSLLHGLQILVPLAGFFLSYSIFLRRGHFRGGGFGVLLALLLTSAIILYQNSDVVLGLGRWRFDEPGIWGPFEVYQFRQYVGSVMASAIPLGLLAAHSWRQRLTVLAVGALVALTVFGMWTAAGRLMALVALLVVALSLFRKRSVIWGGGLAGLTILALVVSVEPLRAEFLQAVFRFADMGGRFPYWASTWADSWAGLFGSAYAVPMGSESLSGGGAHNQLLSLWSRGGILLALLWAGLLIWMLYRSFALLRVARDSPLWWGYAGLATALVLQALLNSVIVVPFEQPYSGIFIWFVYGLVERANRIESFSGNKATTARGSSSRATHDRGVHVVRPFDLAQ